MKVSVHDRFGSPEVLTWADRPIPTPKAGEMVVRLRAATVSAADWRALTRSFPPGLALIAGLIFGFRRPRHTVLGTEFAGEITALGEGVRGFALGDAVAGHTALRFGTHAEYIAVPAGPGVIPKPARLSFAEAAALSFGGATVVSFLAAAKLQAGEHILINGATGAVGSAAIQIAKAQGAVVTAVCSSVHAALARSLGADAVIDYATTDFTTMGQRFDIVLDAAGTAGFARSRAVLARGGRLVLINGGLGDALRAPWLALASDKRIITTGAQTGEDPMRSIARLVEAGTFTPLIGARFDFSAITEAYRLVGSGHKRGSVVLDFA